MTKESSEDRIVRQQREAAAQLAANAAYRASIPTRLMTLLALANQVNVITTVSLTATGPAVRFCNDEKLIDDIITYNSEEWELEYVERKIRELKEEQDSRIRRRGIAEDMWKSKLSDEEKLALKEHIHNLK